MEKETLYNIWKQKYAAAKATMQSRGAKNTVLIEIAAQHPLIHGEEPNEEFEKRLMLGVRLYKEIIEKKSVYFYVPGSRHMDNGVADKISLSEAGKRFLIAKGIPENVIFADDMNTKFKGASGVYNSTDECFVSGKIFDDIGAGELHCVYSSGQMMRKVLSYIHFGYVPYMHTISCDVMYHDYIDEIFKYIPILLEDKDALQGNSEEADRLRKLRKPE